MITQDISRYLEDVSIQVADIVNMFSTNEPYEDFLDQIFRVGARPESAFKEAAQWNPVSSRKPLE